jgi:hypothetical protein
MNWNIIFTIQVALWFIVLFEWKRLKEYSKADKIAFASILVTAMLLACFNPGSTPGPITLLHYVFGPFGRMMEP